jgi:hypothetical protein
VDVEERVRRYVCEVVGDGALGVINSVVQFGTGDRHAVFRVTYTDRSNGTDDLVVRVSVLSDAAEGFGGHPGESQTGPPEDGRPANPVAEGESFIDGLRHLPGVQVGRDHRVPGLPQPVSCGDYSRPPPVHRVNNTILATRPSPNSRAGERSSLE